MSMNKMLVIGNVGNDPEMRYTPNGNPVTSFNVATNRRYTTADGEQHEETEWFRVSAWNRLAETCNQYVTKGMKVYVEGRLKSSPWTTQNGELRAGNEISASDVRFPGPSSGCRYRRGRRARLPQATWRTFRGKSFASENRGLE